MILSEFGQRIRAQREKCGLKQNDIVGALQISPQAVYPRRKRGLSIPDKQPKGVILCDEEATVELKVGTVKYFKDIESANLDPATLL